MPDDHYKNKINALNKTIEKQQKMLKQIAKISTPIINLNVSNPASKQLKDLQEQLKRNYEPIRQYQKMVSNSYPDFSNLTSMATLASELSKIDFNTSFTAKYVSSIQKQMEDVFSPLTNVLSKKISDAHIDHSFSNKYIENISNTINSSINFKLNNPTSNLKGISNLVTAGIDYSSITKILDNNIKTINSIFDNLYNDDFEEISKEEKEKILSKAQNIEFNIPFPEDTSIAEMEATINGEEYDKPDLDYKKFDILLKTTSFIKDPVKAIENLNKALILANHFIDYSLKIQIYTLLKEQIISLIANKLLLVALPLIKLLLDNFLKDNEIYKRFIELKDSIKNIKK